MGVGKSFGISFIVFIVLNFIMNLLIAIANHANIGAFFTGIGSQPWLFIASLFVVNLSSINIGLMPTGLAITNGVNIGYGYFSSNVFYGIMIIAAVILPGLIASIVAGASAESSGPAFGGWMLTMILSGIIVLVLGFVSPTQIAPLIGFILNGTSNTIYIAIWIFVLFIFNGLFWSGIAAVVGREH